jgi:hypothetical protein
MKTRLVISFVVGFAVGLAMSCFADTTDSSKPLGDLDVLSRIPDAPSVSNITLVPGVNASPSRKLDIVAFREILDHSSPAPPEVAESWQFAPWYPGTFVRAGKTNSFSLYLGGLGFLRQPDVAVGLFRFKQPQKRERWAVTLQGVSRGRAVCLQRREGKKMEAKKSCSGPIANGR